MAITYRVVDARSGIIDPSEIVIVGARSPEDAARLALHLDLVRSGRHKDLVARVYWQPPGQPMNMVRLYRRVVG